MRGRLLMVAVLVACGVGCRAKQLQRDQDHMRVALLDMYTNQLMDNLIRAHDGMPIVQLDYKDITGTVTHNGEAGFGQNQSLDTSRNALGVTTARNFANFFEYSLNASQENQLAITADPVLNNNEVYDAYLTFLSKPERFVVGCDPPPPGAAHIMRCVERPDPCRGKHAKTTTYYWVPAEYATDFFRLSLVTTVQRGRPLEVPEYFETMVERVVDSTPPEMQKEGKRTRLTVHLANSIPNDSGTLQATYEGKPISLRLSTFIGRVDGEPVSRGEKVTRLWILLPQEGLPEGFNADKVAAALTGNKVRIDLDTHKPTLPTTDDLLRSINRNTTLLRLGQR